jgi:hypothetical protein
VLGSSSAFVSRLDITGAFYCAWVFISTALGSLSVLLLRLVIHRRQLVIGSTTSLGLRLGLHRRLVLRQRCAAPRLALHVRVCCAWFYIGTWLHIRDCARARLCYDWSHTGSEPQLCSTWLIIRICPALVSHQCILSAWSYIGAGSFWIHNIAGNVTASLPAFVQHLALCGVVPCWVFNH